MLTLLMILALGTHAPSAVHPSVDAPRTLQYTARNTSEGKDRKCRVKIPKGTTLRACDAAEKVAGHCALKQHVVAWTASENGARCELAKKKTDWKKAVGIRVAQETKPGAGSCTLFVSVR